MEIILHKYRDNPEQWLELKSKGIGSSEVAAAIGISRWQTPLELWAKKVGKVAQTEPSAAMLFGQKMERAVAELWAAEHGRTIIENYNLYCGARRHYLATPDFYTEDSIGGYNALLEIKTTRGNGYKDGATPFEHMAQVQWQMGICQVSRAHLVALVNGDAGALEHREIVFEPKTFKMMCEEVDRFWQFVETNTPPPATAGDEKLLAFLAGDKVAEEPAEPTAEREILLDDIARIRGQMEPLKTQLGEFEFELSEAQSRLMQACTGHNKIVGAYHQANWKEVKVKEQLRKAYSFVRFNFKAAEGDNE